MMVLIYKPSASLSYMFYRATLYILNEVARTDPCVSILVCQTAINSQSQYLEGFKEVVHQELILLRHEVFISPRYAVFPVSGRSCKSCCPR
jgi:hypothetical protein